MKYRKSFNEECNRCGSSDVSVMTEAKEEGYAYDGDNAICNECGLMGGVSIDGDEDDNGDCSARIVWDDFDED